MTEEKIEVNYLDNKLSHAYLSKDFAERNHINGIFGPSNLSWKKEVNFSSPLEYLSDKNRKRVLKAKDYALETLKYKVEIKEIIDPADFKEWLYLYKRTILDKDVGILRLNEEWLNRKKEKDSSAGSIMIKDQNNKILGGIIIGIKGTRLSCNYRAHEYIHLKDSSLAALLEYYIDELAISKGIKVIDRGSDINIYGVRLSKGLHDFKLSYNFVPTPLDYNSHYYPRYIIFFKPFESIYTYTYKKDDPTSLELLELNAEEMKQYIQPFDVLNTAKVE